MPKRQNGNKVGKKSLGDGGNENPYPPGSAPYEDWQNALEWNRMARRTPKQKSPIQGGPYVPPAPNELEKPLAKKATWRKRG